MIPIRDSRPSYVFPWVTLAIISLNVLVFLYQLALGWGIITHHAERISLQPWQENGVRFGDYQERSMSRITETTSLSPSEAFIFKYGVVPGEVSRFQDFPPQIPIPIYLTILTSTFLHGGFLHLGGNMLFLWIFGDNVEEALGHLKFLVFYFGSALGAAFLQIIANPTSGTPMIGASGAIAGVLAAYFLLFPSSRILTLVPIFFFFTFVQIPAVIMLGFWFLFQLLRAPAGTAGGVAVLAHIGGFLTGALLTPYLKRREVPLKLRRWFQ
ncbi:MAG: rhomboid family intramembrane serine protease [Candidatus Bipolaricaulota bacterium]